MGGSWNGFHRQDAKNAKNGYDAGERRKGTIYDYVLGGFGFLVLASRGFDLRFR